MQYQMMARNTMEEVGQRNYSGLFFILFYFIFLVPSFVFWSWLMIKVQPKFPGSMQYQMIARNTMEELGQRNLTTVVYFFNI